MFCMLLRKHISNAKLLKIEQQQLERVVTLHLETRNEFGDVVTMRTQADNAFKALDELDSQEAPDALKDVKQCYVDGSEQLENALNAYIELYTEIDSATDAQPFDWSTYDQRLADIQAAYNSGIEKLQEGDKTAADLPQ